MQALQDADRPRSKEELISFLCIIQSNSEFIPNLSIHTANLRELITKNKVFHWTEVHENEFNHLKDAPKMHFFVSIIQLKGHAYLWDAHKKGLGAILSQGRNMEEALPIAIASRTTTKVEKKYPQIDSGRDGSGLQVTSIQTISSWRSRSHHCYRSQTPVSCIY